MCAFTACGGLGSSSSGSADISQYLTEAYGIESGDLFTHALYTSGAVGFEEYWSNGHLREKGYRLQAEDSEKLVGPYQSYYENGQAASEGLFDLGQMQGPWHFWYENGTQRLEGFYVNSILNEDAFWVERDEHGDVVNGSPRASQLAAVSK
ncbi:MAG: hypothetical protein HRU15_09785 [Planctomycetes bacterium]|nr:hypothetical protein [Planctomycetota bacterium]